MRFLTALVAVVALAIVASPARATDFVVRDRTVVLADGSLATVRDVVPVERFGVNRFGYGNSVLLAAGDARIEFALERRRPRPRPVVVIR